MPAHSAAPATSARARASASGAQGPAELRPLLEAQGRAGRKGGAALSQVWTRPGSVPSSEGTDVSAPLPSSSPRTTPRGWAGSDGGNRRGNLRVITVSSDGSINIDSRDCVSIHFRPVTLGTGNPDHVIHRHIGSGRSCSREGVWWSYAASLGVVFILGGRVRGV